MMKFKELIVIGLLFFFFFLLYLKYDQKGYRYGLECSFCNKNMPYGVKPIINSDYPHNFVLFDENGFELTGSGFKHRQSSFKIKFFMGYGFNDTSILLKCTDSLNNTKYLISYETDHKSDKGNYEISFKDIGNSEFNQIKDNYQWVEIDEEKVNTIRFLKFLFMIGTLLSLFFIFIKLFRLRKDRVSTI